jgi:hypothetical protein
VQFKNTGSCTNAVEGYRSYGNHFSRAEHTPPAEGLTLVQRFRLKIARDNPPLPLTPNLSNKGQGMVFFHANARPP